MKPQFWNKGKIYLSKKDKILKKIIHNYEKEYLVINSNYYHCLLNSIIGQQISVKAANSIKRKFFSLKKNINPKTVMNIKIKDFKNAGLSKQKILYVNNISKFYIKNESFFKDINNFNEIKIKENLIKIKGVGDWTINMFLIFSLGRLNIFPKNDLGLLKAIANSCNKKLPLSDEYLNYLNKKWSPYCTIATWYLWRSLDPIPVSY